MQELVQLTQIVSKQKVKQINIITENSGFRGKSRILYESLLNGDITTDEEALELLYDGAKSPALRKLKFRLKTRLINTLFFVDLNKSKREYGRSKIVLMKNWAATEIIAAQGFVKLARRLQEKILHTAISLFRFDIALSIAINLRTGYSTVTPNSKKLLYYDALVDKISEEYKTETKIKSIYAHLANSILTKKKPKEHQLQNYLIELRKLDSKLQYQDNFISKFNYLNSIYFLGMLLKKQSLIEEACKSGLNFIEKTEFVPVAFRFSFYQKNALLLLQKEHFGAAQKEFLELLKFKLTPGGLGWQFCHTYLTLTHILLVEYPSAYELCAKVLNHKAFSKLAISLQENWYIKEAYLHFLIALGRLDISESKVKIKRKFWMGKFLNEVVEPSKDKTGYNLSIIIIQVLFLHHKDEQVLLNEKLDAIKQYSFRYLKGPKYIRPRTFIKLLQKLRYNYPVKVLKTKSRNLLRTLSDNPSDFSEESIQIEIIPYENQWQEIIGHLERGRS